MRARAQFCCAGEGFPDRRTALVKLSGSGPGPPSLTRSGIPLKIRAPACHHKFWLCPCNCPSSPFVHITTLPFFTMANAADFASSYAFLSPRLSAHLSYAILPLYGGNGLVA